MKIEKSPYVNAVDAAASGTSDGLGLAMNVAAMLIVFIAFVAMFDAILSGIAPALVAIHVLRPESVPDWLAQLKLGTIFGWVFSPVAFLMGVVWDDAQLVGKLLGTKLSINEHVAYLQMKTMLPICDAVNNTIIPTVGHISERSARLAAFALTGFANFSSVGIQLGGIGGMAPGAGTISRIWACGPCSSDSRRLCSMHRSPAFCCQASSSQLNLQRRHQPWIRIRSLCQRPPRENRPKKRLNRSRLSQRNRPTNPAHIGSMKESKARTVSTLSSFI